MSTPSRPPSGIPLAPRSLEDLVARHGGELRGGAGAHDVVRRISAIGRAGAGDLAPLLGARYLEDAVAAAARGAILLVDEALAVREGVAALPGWFHRHAAWALAELLDGADAPADEPIVPPDAQIGRGVVILPRVRIGKRVVIGAGAVIGEAGFGFAQAPDGSTRAIPQLGGVVIEDDVHIGPLSTIASGTLAPTRLERGVKLDAQVHVGHNCEIGEGSIIAAQSGLAGSVTVGAGVMMGGQVGVADHVSIGEGARIAAKSGVIGDVPAGATVAGYPAVERHRWLRGLAEMYRLAAGRAPATAPSSGRMRVSGFPSPAPPVVSVPPPSQVPTGLRPEAIIRRTSVPPPQEGGAGA